MDGADQVRVDDSKVESSEAGISESIAEDIIENATTDQKIESDKFASRRRWPIQLNLVYLYASIYRLSNI